MKLLPVAYAAKVVTRTNVLATFLRIARQDGFVVTLTSCDQPVPLGGETYVSDQGLTAMNFRQAVGFAVGNTEVHFFRDDLYVNRNDVLAKRWSDARYTLFRADPLAPLDGVENFSTGSLGDMQITATGFKAELRDDRQWLQQTVGEVSSPTCKALLGDERCKVDLDDWTVVATITTPGRQQFADSSLGLPDDWAGDGSVTFLDGPVVGMSQKVYSFTGAGGVIVLTQPLIMTPLVGNTFRMVAGCRKRLEEDCRDKFNNVRRNQSERYLPGRDVLARPGDVSNA